MKKVIRYLWYTGQWLLFMGVLFSVIFGFFVFMDWVFDDKTKASSYTQWNQNTWQVSDTLYTITAEGDTAKFLLKQ